MHCIEDCAIPRRARRAGTRARAIACATACVAALSLLAGCSSRMPPHGPLPAPGQPGPAAPYGAAASPEAARAVVLPSAQAARNWHEFRLQAAQRMVAASPNGTYLGEVPETLLAIPVLEIELNADGSIRDIDVLRHPRQARDTTQLAIDAVRRAAPFGNVSRLPRPWKFSESFLFDDGRRFKPRTLD